MKKKQWHVALVRSYWDGDFSTQVTDNIDCLSCDALKVRRDIESYGQALDLACKWAAAQAAITPDPVPVYSDAYSDDEPYTVYNARPTDFRLPTMAEIAA